jgi:hypothetical protein
VGGLAPARIYVRPVPDYPADKWRSTYWAHTRRNPPSREPGVDYYCPIGTVLVSIGDGYVSEVGGGIMPATGRYVKVNLDNGQSFRLLHLGPRHSLKARGDRVRMGEPLAISGASGYGSEYFGASSPYDARMIWTTGGPHTHATLFPTHNYNNFAGLLDLEQWVIEPGPAGGSAVPFEPTQEEDMPGIRIHHQVFTNGNQAYVVETETGFLIPPPGHIDALVKAYDIDLSKLPAVNEYDWNAVQYAKTYNNSGYPQSTGVTEAQIQTLATAAATAVAAVVEGIDSAQIVTDIEDRLRGYFEAIPAANADEIKKRLES